MASQGLSDLVGQLAANAKEVARAEVALAKARILATIAGYKVAAMLFAAAGTLALAALIALLLGLILTLAPRVGPGWATTIVVGGVLVIAGILALIGRAKLGKASAP